MKQITMLVIALCVTVVSYAQFEKGTMMVGGSLGTDFTTNKSKFDGNSVTNSKYFSLSLDPQFGIFIMDNLAVGGALGLSVSSYKEDDFDYKDVTSEITIEPMVRYYVDPGIFFQGRFIFGTSTDKETDGSQVDKDKYTVSGLALSCGYAYFLNDNVAIEPQIGYDVKGYKHKDTKVKYSDSGVFIRIGFQIYLRK